MKGIGKVKLVAVLSLLLSSAAFAAASKPGSVLATNNYCRAKAAGNPISVQDAARNAATTLRLAGGAEILVNSACDGRPFEEYSRGAGGGSAGGAAAGGTGAAGFTVSSAAIIVGGVVLAAAAVSGGGGGGDDTNTSP